jgi:hypothetical protein
VVSESKESWLGLEEEKGAKVEMCGEENKKNVLREIWPDLAFFDTRDRHLEDLLYCSLSSTPLMDNRNIRELSLREGALPNLVLPVTSVQPSLTIIATSLSFLLAFGITWLFQGHIVRATSPCLITPSSLGVFSPL